MEDAAGHENAERERKATLYVVATPIGNLKDITLRALEVLKQVDVIAAEDTRVTSRLLNHYAIASRKLIALHEHNEQQTAPHVIELLARGRSVALTSDAGTPAFSDPGARLIAAVREAGYAVVPIPGPNAAAAALSASGFAGPRFLFYGFLPAKAGERQSALGELEGSPHALVFYEAPHRVVETLAELAAAFGGERRIVIARELTKLFETIHVCKLDEAVTWISGNADRQKGEFVLIVDAPAKRPDAAAEEVRRTLDVLLEALPVKQAAALAAKLTGARKNDLYDLALQVKRHKED
jgi:16S rRNA (cytidine1402-2'-O)-methyltransferase